MSQLTAFTRALRNSSAAPAESYTTTPSTPLRANGKPGAHATSSALASSMGPLGKLFQAATRSLPGRASGRRLRVAETVSLGEKRFVSVIEVDGERLLIGGSAQTVSLLAHLQPSEAAVTAPRLVQPARAPEKLVAATRHAPAAQPAFAEVLTHFAGRKLFQPVTPRSEESAA